MAFLATTRLAARSLRRSPALCATVVACWGLAFAANGTMMSIADQVFLRPPLHVRNPAAVFRVYQRSLPPGRSEIFGGSFAYRTALQLAREVSGTARVAAYGNVDATLALQGGGTTIRVGVASDNFFAVLGTASFLGAIPKSNAFESPSSEASVVLSWELWRSRLGGDSAIVGRVLTIHDQPLVVAAVLPPGFTGGSSTVNDAWVSSTIGASWLAGRRWRDSQLAWASVIARLEPRHSASELTLLATRYFQQQRQADIRPDIVDNALLASLVPARGPVRTTQQRAIIWLSTSAVALMVLATLNVSVLMLLRILENWREIMIRRSLGASLGDLLQRVVSELFLLSCGAAVLGGLLVVALRLPTERLLGIHGTVTWWRMAGFGIAAVFAAIGLAGVAPTIALYVHRHRISGLANQSTVAPASARLRNSLVGIEVACAVFLVSAALLFGRSLSAIRRLELGLDPTRVLTVSVDNQYARANAANVALTLAEMERRIRQVPGVTATAITMSAPFRGTMGAATYDEDRRLILTERNTTPFFNAVSHGYFGALGARFKNGRDFAVGDDISTQRVAVVNETFADIAGPSAAVGKCIYLGDRVSPCFRIIGVVREVRRFSVLPEVPAMEVYVPLKQNPFERMGPPRTIVIRSSQPGKALVGPVERAVRPAAPASAAISVEAMESSIDPQVRPWVAATRLLGAHSAVALFIAVVGLSGTLAYMAKLMRREIAIRMALGATRSQVALRSARVGIALTTGAASFAAVMVGVLGTRIAPRLFGITPDAVALCAGIALAAVSLAGDLAALWPMWRASGASIARSLQDE